MTKLSIVVALWKDVDLLDRLLNSIRDNTEGEYEIIIAQSSTPEVYEDRVVLGLRDHGVNVRIIDVPEEGHNKAVDCGLNECTGDYLAWMDVDVVVPEGWWGGIERIFNADPKVGIVSPIFYPRWDQYILTYHGLPDSVLRVDMMDGDMMGALVERRNPEWFTLPIKREEVTEDDFHRQWGLSWRHEDMSPWAHAFEALIVMRRQCFSEIGAYNGARDETGISNKARDGGWKVAAANKVVVWHYHGDVWDRDDYYGRASQRRGGRVEGVSS